jgi:hypothetical protein
MNNIIKELDEIDPVLSYKFLERIFSDYFIMNDITPEDKAKIIQEKLNKL